MKEKITKHKNLIIVGAVGIGAVLLLSRGGDDAAGGGGGGGIPLLPQLPLPDPVAGAVTNVYETIYKFPEQAAPFFGAPEPDKVLPVVTEKVIVPSKKVVVGAAIGGPESFIYTPPGVTTPMQAFMARATGGEPSARIPSTGAGLTTFGVTEPTTIRDFVGYDNIMDFLWGPPKDVPRTKTKKGVESGVHITRIIKTKLGTTRGTTRAATKPSGTRTGTYPSAPKKYDPHKPTPYGPA